MLREIDPVSVIGVVVAATLAIFSHQWGRDVSGSLRDPGMKTVVASSPSNAVAVPPTVSDTEQ